MGTYVVTRKVDLIETIERYIRSLNNNLKCVLDTDDYNMYKEIITVRDCYIADAIDMLNSDSKLVAIYSSKWGDVMNHISTNEFNERNKLVVPVKIIPKNDAGIFLFGDKTNIPDDNGLVYIETHEDAKYYVLNKINQTQQHFSYNDGKFCYGPSFAIISKIICDCYAKLQKYLYEKIDSGCKVAVKDRSIEDILFIGVSDHDNIEDMTTYVFNMLICLNQITDTKNTAKDDMPDLSMLDKKLLYIHDIDALTDFVTSKIMHEANPLQHNLCLETDVCLAYTKLFEEAKETLERFPGCHFVIKDWTIEELKDKIRKDDNIFERVSAILQNSIYLTPSVLTEEEIIKTNKTFRILGMI